VRHPIAASLLASSLLVFAPRTAGQAPAPGLRLFGPMNGNATWLVDVNGSIVHTWPSTLPPGLGVRLRDDGSLLRTIRTTGAPAIGGAGGGVQRLALNGTVLWDFRYDGSAHWSHHDVETLPNGNILLVAWENKTAAQAVEAGRNPALLQGGTMRVDHVIEVRPTGPATGVIVWEWHIFDHLIQDFDPTKANFGPVGSHPELVDFNYPATAAGAMDWNHVNSLHYDPIHDWIVLSAHHQNEIWVIDHGTTTAEAAGHSGGRWGKGGDLLYRWGNPAAYRRGSASAQQLFGQHSPVVLPPGRPGAGNFMVFNNNYPGGSRVWEFVPPLDPSGNFVLAPGAAYGPSGPVWSYSAPGFNSMNISSCRRLPNGNTLICSGAQGRVFEVTAAGQQVWSYTLGANVFHAHYVDRLLWADTSALTGSTGGTATFDLIAGSPSAGRGYLVLASAAGTIPGIDLNGFVLPLNPDDLLLFTIATANTPLLTRTLGTLNSLGRASAALNLPPILLGAPLPVHFASAVFDVPTSTVTATSVAVPLTINP